MTDILKSAFGLSCTMSEIQLKNLPLYMTAGRKFYRVSFENEAFLFVELASDDKFGVIALEKQLNLYEKSSEMQTAYIFPELTKRKREALMERHIPFVSGSDQLYLPFLGLAFRNSFKKKRTYSTEKMMPATQMLFLYLLYRKADYVLKKQAAEELQLTRTSITRASEQLKQMNLIEEETCGKEIHMRTIGAGRELYERARKFLITPVQKTVFLERTNEVDFLIRAGETALSDHSMLASPKYETYAVFKGDVQVNGLTEVDPKWQPDVDVLQVELWKYDPQLFTSSGTVDPVSLAMSLRDNEDERVQGELEAYMEGELW